MSEATQGSLLLLLMWSLAVAVLVDGLKQCSSEAQATPQTCPGAWLMCC